MSDLLKPNRLLAKSFTPGQWQGSYSLVGHTADVVRAVTKLVDSLGDRLLQQFNLTCSLNDLKATAQLAAYLHDWGKANHHFQGIVRHRISNTSPQRNPLQSPQMLRHEILSLLMAWEFRHWLSQTPGDFGIALAAGGGHHLKLGGKGGKCTDQVGEIRPCGEDRIMLYWQHRDFKNLIRFGIKTLNYPSKVKTGGRLPEYFTIQDIKERRQNLMEFWRDWEPDPVLLAVVKALLIAGDAIGSAIPAQTEFKIDQWIRDALDVTWKQADSEKVIRSKGHHLHQFQIDLGNICQRVALARAGCGTGKTLGAYNWAKHHAEGRKLFFCYPTTGTTTEGFLDYVQDDVKSVLIHGRSAVDLSLAETGEEQETGQEEAGERMINEAEMKLASFKAWDKSVIVCTVDTVLGLLQCNRRPMYCFPAIANGAFVFDEVHCYDQKLFGALLRFLETVKAPILLMSASFLPMQLAAIEKAVGEPVEIIQGPAAAETLPRYRFRWAEAPPWERVEAELQQRGKVLWVCNQVNTAIEIYEEAVRRNLRPLIYHSRFCYGDRVQRHRDVVAAFKPEQEEPVLAIATQVAEMSLDLSATLLVSQVAEPAALIQRLGRLNRRYCGYALEACFYDDLKRFPYDQQVRDRGRQLVKNFMAKDVNQKDLAQWLEQEITLDFKPDCQSVWLDGEWRTYPASLRSEGVTITVLLAEHQGLWKRLPMGKLGVYTVPLVVDEKRANRAKSWPRHHHFPIVPREEIAYCSRKGARLCDFKKAQ